jgi:hypothetical protein
MSRTSSLRWLAAAALLAAVFARSAQAADIPVPAKVQMVKQDKKAGFVGKLAKLVGKPNGIGFPLPGTDPRVSGATMRFFQPGVPGVWDEISLPAAGWTGIADGAKGFKYKGAGTLTDPCKAVIVKPAVITAVCKGPGSTDSPAPYAIPVAAGGSAWELVIGGDRYCAESSAATGAVIKKNEADTFLAKDAGAPAVCAEPAAPAGCSSATITIHTSYTPPSEDVQGVTTTVVYPGPKLQRTGSPMNLTGVSGIFNFGDNDSAVPGDGFNDTLSVGLLAIPGDIPPGPFASQSFACRDGAPDPVPGDFTCSSDVSDSFGSTVPSTCSVDLVVNP